MSEPLQLSSPFTFSSKGIEATLIQDTPEEIANCVYNIALCTEGEREDSPTFGIADQTFSLVPLDLQALKEQVARWEPRASQMSLLETEEAAVPAFRRVSIEVP